MGKDITSIHLFDSSTDELWQYLCEIQTESRYHLPAEEVVNEFVQARKEAGIQEYDEDDSSMRNKDIMFTYNYFMNHVKEHKETFYVVQSGKHASVFSSYFCFSEMDDDINRLFASCPHRILTVCMMDEDFLLIGFYEGAKKITSFAMGENIEDIYGISPSVPNAEQIKKNFGIDWKSVETYAPDYMKMLDALSEQTSLPVNLSLDDLFCNYDRAEIEKCTFSLC